MSSCDPKLWFVAQCFFSGSNHLKIIRKCHKIFCPASLLWQGEKVISHFMVRSQPRSLVSHNSPLNHISVGRGLQWLRVDTTGWSGQRTGRSDAATEGQRVQLWGRGVRVWVRGLGQGLGALSWGWGWLERAWFPLDWWAAAAGIPPVTARHPAPPKIRRADCEQHAWASASDSPSLAWGRTGFYQDSPHASLLTTSLTRF